MPQTKRRKGFKACDPFCTDKVRKALYNRPNGPHQGKLILGKTYLSGLDGKCFSRTGRIKKGYRNVPVDLQREFEIERRNIQSIQRMLAGPSKKALAKRKEKKRLKAQQYQQKKAILSSTQNTDTSNGNINTNPYINSNSNSNSNTNNSPKKAMESVEKLTASKPKQKKKESPSSKLQANLMEQQNLKNNAPVYPKPIQNMDQLSRLPTESMFEFIKRVKKTTSYYLNEEKHKEKEEKMETKLYYKQKNLKKKARKLQRKVENKRKEKLAQQEKRKKTKEFKQNKRKFEGKEYIPFGATNDRPPVDLHKLGAEIFGKKTNDNVLRNENGLNISGLSFTKITREEENKRTENRAMQLRRAQVLKNYAKMKQRRYAQFKSGMKQRAISSKRKTWKWKR